MGCHAGPGGRARGLGTSSPCLATTTFSLISTTSRHAGFIHSFVHPLRPLYFCPALCAPKTPPPPCARPAHPLPPSAHQSLQKGPFAAYRHSPPAALPVTRVNDVSGPICGEWGVWAASQVLSLRIYNMLIVFTISRLGLFVADNVAKPQTALACCTSKCHYSAYG